MTEPQQLRCICSGHPLLATYGLDEKNKLYVHIKVFKQRRLYAEVVAYGDVKLHCRQCYRWHLVVIKPHNHAVLKELRVSLPGVHEG